jgi:hypothetical protein
MFLVEISSQNVCSMIRVCSLFLLYHFILFHLGDSKVFIFGHGRIIICIFHSTTKEKEVKKIEE